MNALELFSYGTVETYYGTFIICEPLTLLIFVRIVLFRKPTKLPSVVGSATFETQTSIFDNPLWNQQGQMIHNELNELNYINVTTTFIQHLSYNELLKRLHITSLRELEDLIIEAVYAGLLKGKLDQANQVFRVESVFSRDFKKESLDDLLAHLKLW